MSSPAAGGWGASIEGRGKTGATVDAHIAAELGGGCAGRKDDPVHRHVGGHDEFKTEKWSFVLGARALSDRLIGRQAGRRTPTERPVNALRLKRASNAEVQIAEVRNRQVKDGAAAQPLASEIEDGVGAELGLGASGLGLAARDGDRSDEVLRSDGELNIAIGRIGQAGVEDGLAAAQAEVQRCDGVLGGLSSSGDADNERRLDAVAIKAKVGELRRGVGKDCRDRVRGSSAPMNARWGAGSGSTADQARRPMRRAGEWR
jgi:hypothetical protein